MTRTMTRTTGKDFTLARTCSLHLPSQTRAREHSTSRAPACVRGYLIRQTVCVCVCVCERERERERERRVLEHIPRHVHLRVRPRGWVGVYACVPSNLLPPSLSRSPCNLLPARVCILPPARACACVHSCVRVCAPTAASRRRAQSYMPGKSRGDGRVGVREATKRRRKDGGRWPLSPPSRRR